MTIALRKQRLASLPHISFGPFRFLHGLPWLMLAAAMRFMAGNGWGIALPATIIADFCVLYAFLVTAQRSIEISGGQTSIGELEPQEQFRFSLAILWRLGLLMILATYAVDFTFSVRSANATMNGIDGLAFDQVTAIGKFWSAAIGALALLMVVRAEQSGGRIAFFEAVGEFGRRWFWLGIAVVMLGLINLGFSFGQGLVRNVVFSFWQNSPSSQTIKNLIYFAFVFGFAMLRLWVTLLVLTYGLKLSYIHDGQ
jgi:hypothetical protein